MLYRLSYTRVKTTIALTARFATGLIQAKIYGSAAGSGLRAGPVLLDLGDSLLHRVEDEKRGGVAGLVIPHGFEQSKVAPAPSGRGAALLQHPAHLHAHLAQLVCR